MTIEVNNTREFLEAIRIPSQDLTIYLKEDLLFDDQVDIIINHPNLIITSVRKPDSSFTRIHWARPVKMTTFNERPFNLFRVSGNVIFQNIFFTGAILPDREAVTTWQEEGLQCFIKTDGCTSLVVDECSFAFVNYAAIWDANCKYTRINNCHFDGISADYFGYAVWQGGVGSSSSNFLSVRNCYFGECKHAVAGSYHMNHIIVEDCYFSDKIVKHALDRHSGKDAQGRDVPGEGGGHYYILGNHFEPRKGYAYGLTIPLGGCMIVMRGNSFGREFGKTGTIDTNVDGKKVVLNESNINHRQVMLLQQDNLWCPPNC